LTFWRAVPPPKKKKNVVGFFFFFFPSFGVGTLFFFVGTAFFFKDLGFWALAFPPPPNPFFWRFPFVGGFLFFFFFFDAVCFFSPPPPFGKKLVVPPPFRSNGGTGATHPLPGKLLFFFPQQNLFEVVGGLFGCPEVPPKTNGGAMWSFFWGLYLPPAFCFFVVCKFPPFCCFIIIIPFPPTLPYPPLFRCFFWWIGFRNLPGDFATNQPSTLGLVLLWGGRSPKPLFFYTKKPP